jgi:hypothetical protein
VWRALAALAGRAGAALPLVVLAGILFALPGEPAPLTSPAAAQLQPPPREFIGPPAPVKVQSTPEDAVMAVLADSQTVPLVDLPFQWWFWVPSEADADFQELSFKLQHVSRSASIYQPVRRGPFLARIDLRWYWPTGWDLAEILVVRERLANDPSFALLFTQDTLKLLTDAEKQAMRVPQVSTMESGKQVTVFVPLAKLKDIVLARVNPPRLERAGLSFLQFNTGTLAPVVEWRYATNRLISQVQGKDDAGNATPFTEIYGGQYYAARGIRPATKGFRTDLDQFLFDFGIGAKGQTFEQTFERLRTDAKAAMWKSDVTGKKRVIVILPTLGVTPLKSVPVCMLTQDPLDEDIDLSADPFHDPFAFKFAAYEVIIIGANGCQVFALFNSAGKLLDQAVDRAVADRRTPAPGTTILQPSISCLRCHGPSDGWIQFENDLRVNNFLHLDPERLDRLQGQYGASPRQLKKFLTRARDDYQEAGLLATLLTPIEKIDPEKEAEARKHAVPQATARIAASWAAERADMVGAAEALKWLGFPPAPAGHDGAALGSILPGMQVGVDLVLEDHRVKRLKEGGKIHQTDFALLYSFLLERAAQR